MKITITLNPEQEKYFHSLKYGFMDQNFTNSDIINHALMELLLFEEIREDQVTNFLLDNNKEAYEKAINSDRDFGKKFKASSPSA